MSLAIKKAFLREQNKKYGVDLKVIPREEWPVSPFATKCELVLRNSRFLVTIYRERDGMLRMTVNRTVLQSGSGDWEDGISWDDLQKLKREAGYGDRYAIEVYPADRDLVNVANMRHLWILQEPLPIGWFA